MNWFKHAVIAVAGLALAVGVLADVTNVEAQPKQEHGVKVVIDTGRGISSDVKDKLTPEQIFELEKIKAEQPDVPGAAPLIVAITFACPVMIVALILIYRYRRNQLLHKTLAAMIEKGAPIPPELLQPETPVQKEPRNDLRGGLVLVGVGLGLILCLLAMHNHTWGAGFIPLMIGVGRLIAWKLVKKNGNS